MFADQGCKDRVGYKGNGSLAKITILIPAAGAARRMRGADKLLMPVDGTPQLRRIALQALMTGLPVQVTLRAEDASRRAALAGLDVAIVPVMDADEGMAASLRAGGALLAAGSALMVVPADMPEIGTQDLGTMIAAHLAAPDAILRGAAAGVAGHPVVIPADLVPGLGAMAGDSGARALIAGNAGRVTLVSLPGRRAVLDLDNPEDWSLWQAGRETVSQVTLHPMMANPLTAALARPEAAVLAVITGVVGASYRSPGTMMCFFAGGPWAGSLTNGCIEGDLALHAAEALASGQPGRLRYGTGSPFFDIRLPCGGGLDVLLVPAPDGQVLADLACLVASRTAVALTIGPDGRIGLCPGRPTGWVGDSFVIDQRPGLRILIFGEGAEASVFTRLVQSAGYDHHLTTTSAVTAEAAGGCHVTLGDGSGTVPAIDPWTAVVTFYHDHDKELGILQQVLASPAFYVGAQGSRRVAETRTAKLRQMGVAGLDRLRGPIGLIPSARDPQTLAVSVLAEIIATSQPR
ncbi:MAG: NTP transferase domain-containing protein [Candidatus Saccharibacteria bacterium]|nr:NTP transferase domain-containing protein [Pseudorhodobacter sp.]